MSSYMGSYREAAHRHEPGSSQGDPWAVYFKPNPQARLRLFCFPYAGGGAGIFRTWSSGLPAHVELCAIRLPGRESRLGETCFRSFPTLIQALAHVLIPHLSLPFAFFGHSMGALISFELARQLRKHRGLAPEHLFISAHHAPQIPDTRTQLHQLPEPALVEELRRLNGTPAEVLRNDELMQLMLPVLRADFAICETHVYNEDEPLDCPITVFGGTRDDGVRSGALAEWRQQTRSDFTLHMVPGDHFFLHSARPPLLAALSNDLVQILNRLGQA